MRKRLDRWVVPLLYGICVSIMIAEAVQTQCRIRVAEDVAAILLANPESLAEAKRKLEPYATRTILLRNTLREPETEITRIFIARGLGLFVDLEAEPGIDNLYESRLVRYISVTIDLQDPRSSIPVIFHPLNLLLLVFVAVALCILWFRNDGSDPISRSWRAVAGLPLIVYGLLTLLPAGRLFFSS